MSRHLSHFRFQRKPSANGPRESWWWSQCAESPKVVTIPFSNQHIPHILGNRRRALPRSEFCFAACVESSRCQSAARIPGVLAQAFFNHPLHHSAIAFPSFAKAVHPSANDQSIRIFHSGIVAKFNRSNLINAFNRKQLVVPNKAMKRDRNLLEHSLRSQPVFQFFAARKPVPAPYGNR